MLDLFPYMQSLSEESPQAPTGNGLVGKELGVVRISLGLVSDWNDVKKVIEFCEMIGDAEMRKKVGETRRISRTELESWY